MANKNESRANQTAAANRRPACLCSFSESRRVRFVGGQAIIATLFQSQILLEANYKLGYVQKWHTTVGDKTTHCSVGCRRFYSNSWINS